MPARMVITHALWIRPQGSAALDSTERRRARDFRGLRQSWTSLTISTHAQFYPWRWIITARPYRVYGASRTIRTIANFKSRRDGVIGRRTGSWSAAAKAGFMRPDPKDPERIYAKIRHGQMTRRDHRRTTCAVFRVSPRRVGNGARTLQFRLQWTEPRCIRERFPCPHTAAQLVLRPGTRGAPGRPFSHGTSRQR